MSTDGVLGAAYLPTDGYIDPSQLTLALAEGARRRGAEVATHTRVTGITVERGRVTGVETDQGTIETEIVVNAGGMFAAELGALAGSRCRSCRWRTSTSSLEPSGLPLEMPTMRDPSLLVYFRAGVRRPDHGRVRAALRAVGRSTGSRPTSTAGCSTRTGRGSRS